MSDRGIRVLRQFGSGRQRSVAGTLCYRDGFKTGASTPNGQDAYDGKLVVMVGVRRR